MGYIYLKSLAYTIIPYKHLRHKGDAHFYDTVENNDSDLIDMKKKVCHTFFHESK